METSVTLKKNVTWSNWRFVTKIFENKYDFLRESPSSPWSFFWNPARFSVAKCTPFMGYGTWPWSPLGLRCRVAVDVNKPKPKKSSPDPPSQKEQTNIWSKKSIRLKNKVTVQPIPLGVSYSKLKAQSSKVSLTTFQWKETFELWTFSFEVWNSIRKCHPKWDWLYLDKPVRKPKEIETCDKSGVFWRRCVEWRPRF